MDHSFEPKKYLHVWKVSIGSGSRHFFRRPRPSSISVNKFRRRNATTTSFANGNVVAGDVTWRCGCFAVRLWDTNPLRAALFQNTDRKLKASFMGSRYKLCPVKSNSKEGMICPIALAAFGWPCPEILGPTQVAGQLRGFAWRKRQPAGSLPSPHQTAKISILSRLKAAQWTAVHRSISDVLPEIAVIIPIVLYIVL